MRKYFYVCFGFALLGLGCSMSMAADIGVASNDAIVMAISRAADIPMGYVIMGVNLFFVGIEWISLRKRFPVRYFLQIPVSILMGSIVNVLYYGLWSSIEWNTYFSRLALLFAAYIINTFAIAMLLLLDKVNIPMDSCCQVIGDQCHISYGKVRQLLDVLMFLLSAAIAIGFHTEIPLREGTVIGMIVFGPLVEFWKKHIKHWIQSKKADERIAAETSTAE